LESTADAVVGVAAVASSPAEVYGQKQLDVTKIAKN